MPATTQRGVSLIEIMIGVAIIGLVIGLGIPSFTGTIRDSRVRAMADEYSDGLVLARQEAINRNRTIRFEPATTGWRIVLPGSGGTADQTLATRTALTTESAFRATASLAAVSFTGSGRASTGAFTVDVTHATAACRAAGGDVRCLRVMVAPGGAIRSCDPAVAAPDPRSC
jgi:type IV fimbrial biogenesis protein FimT